MNRKLLAALAAVGVLAGGGTAAALAAAGGTAVAAPAASAAVSTTFGVPVSGPLASLVAKGTITQAQADAVYNAMIDYMRAHWADMPGRWSGGTPPMLATGGPVETVLTRLVENGTLSRSQADAIAGAMTGQLKGHWRCGTDAGARGPGMMRGRLPWAPSAP